jgi:lipopolysaccharide/colanic/teichoic acid biosynthesis glycosyltransferase/branched-subunit amino acid transport protein
MHRFHLTSIDLACVCVATILALALRDNLELSPARLREILPYLALSLFSAAVAFPLMGTNRAIWRYSTLSDYLRVLTAVLAAVLGAVALGFALNRLEDVARALPILQGILLVALMTMVRVWQRLRHTRRIRPPAGPRLSSEPRETVLVVGIDAVAELFLRAVAESAEERIRIAGIVGRNERQSGRSFHNHAILGTPEQLPSVLRELEVHGVFVDRIIVTQAFERLMPAAREALGEIEAGSDIVVDYFSERLGFARGERSPASSRRIAPTSSEAPAKSALDTLSTFAHSPALKRPYWTFKRTADIVGASILILVLSPFIALVGMLVALDVGRPALFWQLRPGMLGRPFKLYKFRTMRAAHDIAGARIPDEDRQSSLGRFLRRSRLDELPQIFHILAGQMSFVGPRPLLPADQAPQHSARLSVRPGLTGWAQVNGGREVSADDKAALDIWYVDNASFRLDLVIIARTVRTLLFGEHTNSDALSQARQALARRDGMVPGFSEAFLPAGTAIKGAEQRRVA